MIGWYILNDLNEPILLEGPYAEVVHQYCLWEESHMDKKVVAKTFFRPQDEVEVSTVFLGMDHSHYFGMEPHLPMLWETLVFRGPLDGEMDRYPTYELAVKGHKDMCLRVAERLEEPKND